MVTNSVSVVIIGVFCHHCLPFQDPISQIKLQNNHSLCQGTKCLKINFSGFSRRHESDKYHAWFGREGKTTPVKDNKPKSTGPDDESNISSSRSRSPGQAAFPTAAEHITGTPSPEHEPGEIHRVSHAQQPVFPSPSEDNPRTSQAVFPNLNKDFHRSQQYDKQSYPSSAVFPGIPMLTHQPTSHTSQAHPSGDSSYSGIIIPGMPLFGLNTHTPNTNWPQYP